MNNYEVFEKTVSALNRLSALARAKIHLRTPETMDVIHFEETAVMFNGAVEVIVTYWSEEKDYSFIVRDAQGHVMRMVTSDAVGVREIASVIVFEWGYDANYLGVLYAS